MPTVLAVTLLGFLLGARHATDPDHVIAVTTIVARHRSIRGAAAIGAVWGVGHTLTILVVGTGIIVFKWAIPPRVGLSMELAVGLMLVALGLMNLSGVLERLQARTLPPAAADAPAASHAHAPSASHAHAHQHGDYVHTHAHAHDPERHPHAPDRTPLSWLDRHFASLGAYQLLRPLAVGVVHGLAGSAAVALLVLTTIQQPAWAVAYLLVFGLGTVAGMMLITAAIGIPFAATGAAGGRSARLARVNRGLRLASGVVSLAFGLFIAWKIGFVDGLFRHTAHWTPE